MTTTENTPVESTDAETVEETTAQSTVEEDQTDKPEQTETDDKQKHINKLVNESKKYRLRAKEAETNIQELQQQLKDSEEKLETYIWSHINTIARSIGVLNPEVLKTLGLNLDSIIDPETGFLTDNQNKVIAAIEKLEQQNGVNLRDNGMRRLEEIATAAIDDAAFNTYYTATLWESGISPFEFIDVETLEPKPAEEIITRLEQLHSARMQPLRNMKILEKNTVDGVLPLEEISMWATNSRKLLSSPVRYAPTAQEAQDELLKRHVDQKIGEDWEKAMQERVFEARAKWNGIPISPTVSDWDNTFK